MNRRGLLGAILATGVAPAAVASGILMPVRRLALPPLLSAGPFDWPWAGYVPFECSLVAKYALGGVVEADCAELVGANMPMLMEGRLVGFCAAVADGLIVRATGRIVDATVQKMIRDGALAGVSIGYREGFR